MPPQIEVVEQRFASQAGALQAEMVDLNNSMSKVQKKLDGMLAARNQLMGMYGVPPDPKWKPSTPAVAAVAPPKAKAKAKAACAIRPPSTEVLAARARGLELAEGACGVVSYKSKLLEAVAKKHKKPPTKDGLLFTVSGTTGTGFSCTLTSSEELLAAEYATPSPCSSNMAAQNAVAIEALRAEYPEQFATLPSPPAEPAASNGQKRKGDVVALSEKALLLQLIQVLVARPLTKEDMIYTCAETGEDAAKTFTCTVSLPALGKAKRFTGAAAAVRKEAELNAAKLAHDTLQRTCKAQIEEMQARKKAKAAEQKEAKKKSAAATDTSKPAA